MKNKKVLILAGIVLLTINLKNSYSQNSNNNKIQMQADSVKIIYTCTMHPEVASEKAGKCPKCGMDLVKTERKADKTVYICPMHHEIQSDKPGKCPKCGMAFVKQVQQIDNTVYTCPMHPQIKSDKPGKCPICGMELGINDNTKGEKHNHMHSNCGMQGM
jgi:transcription initiation factor IIE alpha subunit